MAKNKKENMIPRARSRTESQTAYLTAMRDNELVFGVGPAGTGKTYLAAAYGAVMLHDKRVDRLVLSRPAMEAGEKLGFLPGGIKEKIDPYLGPLYDALNDVLGKRCAGLIGEGAIEIAPLGFMRGRTFKKSFIVLDEAQNCTTAQMKMFLTRLGEGSRMVVTGDLSQSDLPGGPEGLSEAVTRLVGIESVAIVRFGTGDIVRHPLVSRIVRAYE